MGWTSLIFGWRMEMRDDVKNAPWWCTGILVRSVRMCEGVEEVRGVGKRVKGMRQDISDMALIVVINVCRKNKGNQDIMNKLYQ